MTIIGDGLVRAGEALWPSVNPITNNALPVVILTVQVTKDTVTGLYTVASFKNVVITTVVLRSIETRLFGTEFIRYSKMQNTLSAMSLSILQELDAYQSQRLLQCLRRVHRKL